MDEQPKQWLAETRTPRPAQPGRPANYDYEYVRQQLHRLAVRGTAGPVAHGRGGSSALPPGRASDPGLRQFEHAYLRLVLPGLSAGRGAPPGPTRTPGVYAPTRQLAQHGRTGTERPDAPSPGPAHGRRPPHAQVVAWAEDRNAAQTGIDWQFRTEDARVRLKNLYPVIEI